MLMNNIIYFALLANCSPINLGSIQVLPVVLSGELAHY